MSIEKSHPAAWSHEQLKNACETERVRRSGPGGQHRNKVETGIVLTFQPTGTQGQASEERSQAENLAMAFLRLRLNLAIEYRRKITEPVLSELWQRRCAKGKLMVNTHHSDYVMLLAELFDLLEFFRWEIQELSSYSKVSQSQILKFLKQVPKAHQHFQHERIRHGLHPLK